MTPPVAAAPPVAAGLPGEPLSAAPEPLQGNEPIPYLPSSQTVVNGTQTEGECGSEWAELGASDDTRCAYQEVNTGPTQSAASLLPNANGDTVAWTAVNCDEANEWDCVNDDPNDGDATYLRSATRKASDSLENLGTVDITGMTVLSATVTIWCRQMTTSTVAVRTLVKTHGTVYAGANYNCPNSPTYGSTSTAYAMNPSSGTFWTQAEIDALQAGVRDGDGSSTEVRASEVRVDVTYTTALPASASLLPNANGDTVAWTAVNCDEANEWDCVNDDPNDGDATYLRSATKSKLDSLENLETVGIGGATVLSVTVTISCRQMTTSTVGVATLIKTHGTIYAGASYNCPNSSTYGATSTNYAKNAYTGAAWTQAEIDALQAGVRDNDRYTLEVRVSEVRVTVAYIDASPNYAFEAQFTWTDVPTSAVSWLLVVECQRLSPGTENVPIQVGQGGSPPTWWKTVYVCSSDTDATYDTYELDAAELAGGTPSVRAWDAQADAPHDTTQGTMSFDVLRIDAVPPEELPWMTPGYLFEYSIVANYVNPPQVVPPVALTIEITIVSPFSLATMDTYDYPGASEPLQVNQTYNVEDRTNPDDPSWAAWLWVGDQDVQAGYALVADKTYLLETVTQDCYLFTMTDGTGNESQICFDAAQNFFRYSTDHIFWGDSESYSTTTLTGTQQDSPGGGAEGRSLTGDTAAAPTQASAVRPPRDGAMGPPGGPAPLDYERLYYTFVPPYSYANGGKYEFQEGVAVARAQHYEEVQTGRLQSNAYAFAGLPYGRARADSTPYLRGPPGEAFSITRSGNYRLWFRTYIHGAAMSSGMSCAFWGCMWASGFVVLDLYLFGNQGGQWLRTYEIWRSPMYTDKGVIRYWDMTREINLDVTLGTGTYFFYVQQRNVELAANVLVGAASAWAVIDTYTQRVQVFGPL